MTNAQTRHPGTSSHRARRSRRRTARTGSATSSRRSAAQVGPELVLTDPDRAVETAEAAVRKDNPLRRVRIGCCLGWRRDAVATEGMWVWCDQHSDWSRVVELAE